MDLRDAAKSLLLLKPSMAVTHSGGLRLPKDSGDFQTTLRWVQDGAPYHRAAPVTAFFEQHRDRLHVIRLPSYSPDYNPIEARPRSHRDAA